MKTNKTIFAFAVILITGLQAYATHSALYLKAAANESTLIDWVKTEDSAHYKIYLRVDGKYQKKIVPREDLSLSSEVTIDGHFKNQFALAYNEELNRVEQCKVNDVFQNGEVLVYCDVLVNGEAVRHEFAGSTKSFVPELLGTVEGMKKDDRVTLKVNTDLTRAGSKVKIKAFFANGKALVKEVGFDQKTLIANANTSIVNVSELEK